MRPTFAKNSTGGRRPAAGPMAGVRRTPTKASVAAAIRHAAHGLRFRARPDRFFTTAGLFFLMVQDAEREGERSRGPWRESLVLWLVTAKSSLR